MNIPVKRSASKLAGELLVLVLAVAAILFYLVMVARIAKGGG